MNNIPFIQQRIIYMKNNILKTLLVVTVVSTVSIMVQSCTDSKGNNHTIPKSNESIPVKVIQLEKSSGTNVITASGKLTTNDETILSFKIGGVVATVLVKEGDPVKKGQLIAKLNPIEINSQVSQAKQGFEKALRDFNRVTNLYRDSVATLEQLQNAETASALAKEQYDAAVFNRSYSEIHAPANGYVLKKFVNEGQVVGVGDPILQTNGAADGHWILKIGVSDKQWSAIQLNTKASVTVDAFPGRTFEASVIRKSETSDPQTGIFTIELNVNNQDAKFASGMFGAAKLSSNTTQTSWSVPYDAVLDASDNEGFVFITNDNTTAIKQAVTIESFNNESIRISKGLESARALIVSGSAYLSDQSTITIVK
jgi:RND family efflux transporter MFP subunit